MRESNRTERFHGLARPNLPPKGGNLRKFSGCAGCTARCRERDAAWARLAIRGEGSSRFRQSARCSASAWSRTLCASVMLNSRTSNSWRERRTASSRNSNSVRSLLRSSEYCLSSHPGSVELIRQNAAFGWSIVPRVPLARVTKTMFFVAESSIPRSLKGNNRNRGKTQVAGPVCGGGGAEQMKGRENRITKTPFSAREQRRCKPSRRETVTR